MEHPILFINLLLEKLGVHVPAQPHSLAGCLGSTSRYLYMGGHLAAGDLSALAARSVKMVPEGGQNFFELVITGIEDFMIGITGEEGRFMFPLIASLGFFILCSNYLGVIPGFYSPTANLNTTARVRADCRRHDPRARGQVPWDQVYQAFYGTCMVAHSAHHAN